MTEGLSKAHGSVALVVAIANESVDPNGLNNKRIAELADGRTRTMGRMEARGGAAAGLWSATALTTSGSVRPRRNFRGFTRWKLTLQTFTFADEWSGQIWPHIREPSYHP